MARSSTETRLARLDALESHLKADEALTAQSLAAALGISPRSLFRDLALLRERGLPIEADRGRGGGVRLHRMWGVGRLALSYREAVGLLVSLTIAERLGAPWLLGDPGPVRRKLEASFAPPLKSRIAALKGRILIGGTASPMVLGSHAPPQAAAAGALAEAFVEQRQLGFAYPGRPHSQRRVEPHYLLLNAPVWYLLAWDLDRAAIRTFRCDRIGEAAVLADRFAPRPLADFAQALEGSRAAPA
jgi:predicted DNA-binding transcriptional regulator YafY